MQARLRLDAARTVAVMALWMGGGATSTAAAPSLTALDFEPAAVSADGSTVVGTRPGFWEAVRRTATDGTTVLGNLAGYGSSRAFDVSNDGSVVVGHSWGPEGNYQPFRWTAGAGLTPLGHLPGNTSGVASGVSSDGSVVVGASGWEAYRWTADGGIVGLGRPPGDAFVGYSYASAVSADGAVAVGGMYISGGHSNAFRWTTGEGKAALGVLPAHADPVEGYSSYSEAFGVSADGRVVVGESGLHAPDDSIDRQAFRWTTDGGMIALGTLPGDQRSYASAASADGSIVIGGSLRAYPGPFDIPQYVETAFVWDQVNGMRSLRDVLSAAGVDVTGKHLGGATGISADGLTIVGTSGDARNGWIAVIPEPSAAAASDRLSTAQPEEESEGKKGPSLITPSPAVRAACASSAGPGPAACGSGGARAAGREVRQYNRRRLDGLAQVSRDSSRCGGVGLRGRGRGRRSRRSGRSSGARGGSRPAHHELVQS